VCTCLVPSLSVTGTTIQPERIGRRAFGRCACHAERGTYLVTVVTSSLLPQMMAKVRNSRGSSPLCISQLPYCLPSRIHGDIQCAPSPLKAHYPIASDIAPLGHE
jgi:hypothetical protein